MTTKQDRNKHIKKNEYNGLKLKLNVRFCFSSFHKQKSTSGYGSETGPDPVSYFKISEVMLRGSSLVLECNRCHHCAKEGLQRDVVRIQAWGQAIEGIRKDAGDILELKESCTIALTATGAAVIDYDNTVVTVTYATISAVAILVTAGVVAVIVVVGRTGAGRAGRAGREKMVASWTNANEMSLDRMSGNQRDVGDDPMVTEQKIPRKTTCKTTKKTIKRYRKIRFKIFMKVKCKVVNIEKVHSFLRQINSEWCTDTIATMRTKPYNIYDWHSVGNNCMSYLFSFKSCFLEILSKLITVTYDKTSIDKGQLPKANPELTNLECFLSIPQTNFFKGSMRTQMTQVTNKLKKKPFMRPSTNSLLDKKSLMKYLCTCISMHLLMMNMNTKGITRIY
jgi:hypothetical protein